MWYTGLVSSYKVDAFEVDIVAALVTHPVRQRTYGSEDIAVATPYMGKLQESKGKWPIFLANIFEVIILERCTRMAYKVAQTTMMIVNQF